jgi:hypothetical protein
MSATVTPQRLTGRASRILPEGLLGGLECLAQLFENLGPDWYASIMGTGIIATGVASLQAEVDIDAVLWLAGTLLGLITCVWIPDRAHDPPPDRRRRGPVRPPAHPWATVATPGTRGIRSLPTEIKGMTGAAFLKGHTA